MIIGQNPTIGPDTHAQYIQGHGSKQTIVHCCSMPASVLIMHDVKFVQPHPPFRDSGSHVHFLPPSPCHTWNRKIHHTGIMRPARHPASNHAHEVAAAVSPVAECNQTLTFCPILPAPLSLNRRPSCPPKTTQREERRKRFLSQTPAHHRHGSHGGLAILCHLGH